MKSFALISVSDKKNLDQLIPFFEEQGIAILSTGGTSTHLQKLGAQVIPVEHYTESPEILGGRVKTLHPRVHGGILARRHLPEDLAQLEQIGGGLINFVVVNLYPFTQQVRATINGGNPDHPSLVEFIDIGGPTMIRAAAKNFRDVVALSDPADYAGVMTEWRESGELSLTTRRRLAAKVFAMMAEYDLAIARYFAIDEQLLNQDGSEKTIANIEGLALERSMELRYGENPHQQAALYRRKGAGKPSWNQVQGKELSYNNLLDLQAALELTYDLDRAFPTESVAVIIKHLNPCGSAVRSSPQEAFLAARQCDPLSAFGGIVALTGKMDGTLAKTILEGFVEVVVADEFTEDALAAFAAKKNVRVIRGDSKAWRQLFRSPRLQYRDFLDEIVIQTADIETKDIEQSDCVVGSIGSEELRRDMEFAWRVCKHVKSNAIVIVKGLQAIGVGAGQMSRVDSAKLAISRATHHGFDIKGSVAASDAFLPFPDTLEVLNDSGVTALVQPGGSLKDEEVRNAAEKRKMTMVLTGQRHFRH